MKRRRVFQGSLLLCWMTFMLWTTAIPAKAGQIEKTVENQTVETKQQEEEIIQIEDVTGLDNEFKTLEEESVIIVEEVEQYRKEAKRKRIQTIVVVVLVIAIFGVGIITGLREKKGNDSILTDKEEDKAEKVTGGQT